MKHTIARMLSVGLLAALGFVLLNGADPSAARAAGVPPGRTTPRIVYIGGGLSDEGLITLGAAVAARPGALLLLDSKPLSPYLRHFLAAYRPDQVIPVGAFPLGKDDLEQRLGVKVDTPIPCDSTTPVKLWENVYPTAPSVVVCSARPRAVLLQAATLAGAMRAPLWISRNKPGEAAVLRQWLRRWGTKEIVFAGAIDRLHVEEPGLHVRRLSSAPAIGRASERRLAAGKGIVNAVLANPADLGTGLGGMSVLAPWLAVQKRAALLLTDAAGSNAVDVVAGASQRKPLTHLDTLILAANLKALPMVERPNPIPADKDPVIELEPLTPKARIAGKHSVLLSDGPVSYAIGRLFHNDLAAVPLMLARQRLLTVSGGSGSALVASDPGGSLPLLETFSRNTAQELNNAGYSVSALYGNSLTGERLRKEMAAGHDVFLWEGHHNTLVKEWGFATWNEPLPPMFVFLQSCLALQDWKVQPLLNRGAIGVLGTSTRTYSGSGGAMSLAFFDALLYENQSLGGSLRQAKNFLLAYASLKDRRLGGQAARTGANLRAAWAFTLWGDPTFRLPHPGTPASALSGVRHVVTGNSIVIELPNELHGTVRTARYQVRMAPNSRLAGLVRKKEEQKAQPLVPLVFAEVYLPRARPGMTPRLRTRLPASNWVFLWDARRRTGYLLAAPRARDYGSLRFGVDWYGETVVERSSSLR